MFFAHYDVDDYRFYYGFKVHDDGTLTMILHDKIHKANNGHYVSMGECQSIVSGPNNVLEAIVINTKKYRINNPKPVSEFNLIKESKYG